MRRLLVWAFFLAASFFLGSRLRTIEWASVAGSLQGYTAGTVALSVVASAATVLAYGCYELFGHEAVRPPLTRRMAFLVAVISYAFNLNLGALLGGIGFRFRLYAQLGLGRGAIARMAVVSIATNWLGYLLLAGAVFVGGGVDVPASWRIGGRGLQALGGAALLPVAGYLALCRFSRRRSWSLRGQELRLPRARAAALQLVTSCCHWAFMAGIVWAFLRRDFDYLTVLTVLLASAVAGAATHVPGALGVLETVFLSLLGGEASPAVVLAGLIAYRAVFYLLPLAVAAGCYLALELRLRRATPSPTRAARDRSAPPTARPHPRAP